MTYNAVYHQRAIELLGSLSCPPSLVNNLTVHVCLQTNDFDGVRSEFEVVVEIIHRPY